MSAIDVEALLAPISDESPSGENLEYDPEFSELERISAGKEERYSGGELIPAEEPDWKAVRESAVALFARTKDLRVAVQLIRAQTALEGIEGLASATAVLRGVVERFWDDLHPRLEAEDDYDPVFRLNALAPLSDVAGLLGQLRKVPLAEARSVGRFTFRDLDLAEDRATPPEGESAPTLSLLRGALSQAGADYAPPRIEWLRQAREDLTAVTNVFYERAQGGQYPDFSALDTALGHGQAFLESSIASDAPAGDESAEAGGDAGGGAGGAGGGGAVGVAVGSLRTREDVKRVLDQVCEFLERNEPSNPAPLLIRRGRRLLDVDFMQIIQDLAPEALATIERLAGTEGQAQASE